MADRYSCFLELAGNDYSFYAFEGMKVSRNRTLHVTSTRFDEPRCVALVTDSESAVAIHGEESPGQTVFVGGRDQATLKRVRASLEERGFASRGIRISQARPRPTFAIGQSAVRVFSSS